MHHLNSNLLPAENFDLTHFYLQLPSIPTKGTVDQKSPTELQDYESPLFFTDKKDGSMTFICPTKGHTTKNSKYCRTELREEREFDFYDGIHMMYGQLKVSKIAKGKGLIFAQIHGTNPDLNPQLCKLYYDPNGNIYIQYKNDADPSSQQKKYTLTNCKLGEIFKFLILLNRGKLTVSINGQKIDVPFKNQYWKKQSFYFKFGNYCQDNTSDDHTIIQCYDLHVVHT